MIIGLVGFKDSGKGESGRYLVEEKGFKEISFAGPLKDIISTLFNWPRHLLEGDTKESREWRETVDQFWADKLGIPGFTPRYAMQYVGTEIIRNKLYYSQWVVLLEKRIKDSEEKNIVVTDCRFKNELKLLQDMGGFLLRVKNRDPYWYDLALNANNGDQVSEQKLQDLGIHQSERDWIGYPTDYVIRNEADLKYLHDQIDHFLGLIQKG